MIDHATISTAQVLTPSLKIVPMPSSECEEIKRKRNYFLAKRFFDIIFSAFFIIGVLSWLLPILCLMVKLSSKGPVFFLQRRVGRGGKSFTCFKLRTMVINDSAHTQQATDEDSRITSLGWFLRKSNIDEFPQFFNILKGDMSVVGPRPHMHADCNRFSAALPGYKSRNLVKPGLTGLAQVKGYHGPTTTRNCVLIRYHWDIYYIKHIGWILDGKILLHTIGQRVNAIAKYLLEQRRQEIKHTKEAIHD
jgi:putative colanic acid biosynthesis UDP-glucose lipid carrier transferase